MFGGDELVAQLPRVGLRFIEYLIQLPGERRLRARLLGISRHLASNCLAQLCHADTELLKNGDDDSFVLSEERHQEMEVVHERIAGASRQIHRFIECFRRFYCESIWIDHEIDEGFCFVVAAEKVQRWCRIKPAKLA